jgi:hypothetical protein
VLRLGYGLRPSDLGLADVVVSAGGNTLAANVSAAKLLKTPNIFCGSLRQLTPKHVALILVSLERLATHPNYLVTLPPSPVERPMLRNAQVFGNDPPRTVGLLIGGNSGAVRFKRHDWDRLVDFLLECYANHGTQFIASTSRRSDDYIANALTRIAAEPGAHLRLIDYRIAGPGTLNALYSKAEAILCTDDSTMMVSEAIGACLPLIALQPAITSHEGHEAEYREELARAGWYRAIRLSELTSERFLDALVAIKPRTTTQIDELAAALHQRLPQLFVGGAGRKSDPPV